jgi:hypothetical protein
MISTLSHVEILAPGESWPAGFSSRLGARGSSRESMMRVLFVEVVKSSVGQWGL